MNAPKTVATTGYSTSPRQGPKPNRMLVPTLAYAQRGCRRSAADPGGVSDLEARLPMLEHNSTCTEFVIDWCNVARH